MSDLYLIKEVYSYDAVIQSISDFSRLAQIEVKEEEYYWRCIFSECRFSINRTKAEFENYVIALCNRTMA